LLCSNIHRQSRDSKGECLKTHLLLPGPANAQSQWCGTITEWNKALTMSPAPAPRGSLKGSSRESQQEERSASGGGERLLGGGTFSASTNTAATGLEAGCSDVLVHGQSNAISMAAFRVQSVQLREPAEPTRAANIFCQPDITRLRSAFSRFPR
jgi:hypothetical protein